MIDYHVHTALCNHAEGTMENYIRHAIAKGIREICFLDHLTLNEQGKDQSMSPGEVAMYYYAARRLRDRFAGAIDVKVGLEVDFTPVHMDAVESVIEQFSFDVIGGSIHFVDNKNIVSSRTAKSAPFDHDADFYDRYLDLLEKMVDYSCFDLICHVDVLKKFGKQPPVWFYEKMDAFLDRVSYNGLVLEINTSGLSHPAKAIYPDPVILKKCIEKDIFLTIGSDAHRPEQVGRSFDYAASVLQSAGYRYISGFSRRKRYDIPLYKKSSTGFNGGPN